MTTTDTLTQLVAAVVANPDESAPRLMLVDELLAAGQFTLEHVTRLVQDRPESDGLRLLAAEWYERCQDRVTCKLCCGSGAIEQPFIGKAPRRPRVVACPSCKGTGTVPDPGNAARGELIRVQCELASLGQCSPTDKHQQHRPCCRFRNATDSPPWCRFCSLQAREDAILAAHRETWERLPCGACGGEGYYDVPDADGNPVEWRCRDCNGVGDFLRQADGHDIVGKVTTVPRPHTWDRGWLVVECDSADVWETRDVVPGSMLTRTAPTPWASAVAREVVGIRVSDWPVVRLSGGGFCTPHCHENQRLPDAVSDTVYHGQVPKAYPTQAAAVDALAWAVQRWARGQHG